MKLHVLQIAFIWQVWNEYFICTFKKVFFRRMRTWRNIASISIITVILILLSAYLENYLIGSCSSSQRAKNKDSLLRICFCFGQVYFQKMDISTFWCHESRRSFGFGDNFVLRFAVVLCFGTAVFLHLQTSFKSYASWSPTAFLTEHVNEPQVMVKVFVAELMRRKCLEVHWFRSVCCWWCVDCNTGNKCF